MDISEPEPWSFNNEDQFKKYEAVESSTDDSDDEELFKKIVGKEKLSFE